MALKRAVERLRRKIKPPRQEIVLAAVDPETKEYFYRVRLTPRGRRDFSVIEEIRPGERPEKQGDTARHDGSHEDTRKEP